MTEAGGSLVADLSQSSVRQRHGFSSYPIKLSLFAISYFIAYAYGTLFLQTAPAPLWFPDSVLLCTLLLTPIHEWWLYLAIAVPIRFIPNPYPAVPVWFIFATSANDMLKAVSAAYLLRRLPKGSKHPSTMAQLATYFGVAVFTVPLLSAFAGAATRHLLGYEFWASWYQWFLGDALANVVLTPALLYWSSKRSRALRPNAVELAVWVTGFALSLIIALKLARSSYSPVALSVPVPFLIWAATRFGLIGASTSLSVIAVLATANIAEKSTLFSMGFESNSLLFLQLFLFVVSIPVLCIAAVMEEKNSAENNFRDSERRLGLAAQAGRMFAYSWDAATDAIECSGESIGVLGVKSDPAATGTAMAAMVHPDDKERLQVALTRLTLESPELKVTYRAIRPDGAIVWLDRNGRAYFDEQGKLERIIGMVADVTEQKRAEETLREYEKAVEGAEDMIGIVDREYRFVLANREYLKMRNMSREQVVGHFIHEISGKEVFESVIKPKLDECFQGKVVRYEAKFSYPTRGERDFLLSYFPIDGPNGIDRATCILRDITERKLAEAALRASEERLRLAQWAAHIGTFDVNMRTGVDIWPPETEALYGLPPGGFARTLTAFENLIHPDDRERVIGLTQEMIRTGQPTEAEWRTVWPDGSIHWIASRGQVLMDESGTPSRMLGVNMDVTERKRAEELLSGMTRKLLQAQEEERARIARELHDDINQRLAMLAVGLAQLQDDPTDVPGRAQQLRTELAQISNDVQALSHDLHSSQLEYLGAVAGMKSWCKEFSDRQKMEVECRHDVRSILPPEIGLCLFRVLQEALHNAAKHSGVKQVRVQLREESGEVHLIVSDCGRGFDVEAVKQGKGLGLTSMRERVRLVNGSMTIESKPMGGTTIHVRVPLASEKHHQRAVSGSAP